eukprot:2900155-Pyramimonas_sp.AAC.1
MDITLPTPPTSTAGYDSINRHPEAVAERRYLASLRKEEAGIEEETKVWATEEDIKDYEDKDPWFEQQSDPWRPTLRPSTRPDSSDAGCWQNVPSEQASDVRSCGARRRTP